MWELSESSSPLTIAGRGLDGMKKKTQEISFPVSRSRLGCYRSDRDTSLLRGLIREKTGGGVVAVA